MLLQSIRSFKTGSILLAALAATTLPAFGGDTETYSKDSHKAVVEKPTAEPRLYVALLGGGEFDTELTNFTSNGNAIFTVSAPRVGAPVGVGAPLPAYFQARDFDKTHDAAVVDGRLELGYKVVPYLSIFAGFTYSHAGGNDRANIGTVIDSFGAFGTAGRRYDLYAGVGQYQAAGGMVGFKINTPRTILDFLHIPKAIKPYLSASAGAKYLDDQYIRFYTDNISIVDTPRYKLYDSSWVFTTEAELGYDLQLTRNISVILENGYGYDTAPDHGSLPAAAVNRSGSRLYSTVSLGAKLSF